MMRELIASTGTKSPKPRRPPWTALVMPFTYSIANGIAFGFISYVVLKTATGKVH